MPSGGVVSRCTAPCLTLELLGIFVCLCVCMSLDGILILPLDGYYR